MSIHGNAIVFGLLVTYCLLIVVYLIRRRRHQKFYDSYQSALRTVAAYAKYHKVWPELFDQYDAEFLKTNYDRLFEFSTLIDVTRWDTKRYCESTEAAMRVFKTANYMCRSLEKPPNFKIT